MTKQLPLPRRGTSPAWPPASSRLRLLMWACWVMARHASNGLLRTACGTGILRGRNGMSTVTMPGAPMSTRAPQHCMCSANPWSTTENTVTIWCITDAVLQACGRRKPMRRAHGSGLPGHCSGNASRSCQPFELRNANAMKRPRADIRLAPSQ